MATSLIALALGALLFCLGFLLIIGAVIFLVGVASMFQK